jgi:Kef-type K+ transport system membrane component KefB
MTELCNNCVVSEQVALYLLIDMAIIIVMARLFGLGARRLGQPAVIGEILAGIVLGPTLLGRISSDLPTDIFPANVPLKQFADIGLVFFMFLVGLELDTRLLKSQGRRAVQISLSGIALPLVFGILVGFALYSVNEGGAFNAGAVEEYGIPNRLTFAMFIGAAMCITAFPVLARILLETGLSRTAVGTATLCAAAVDDVMAWVLLAAVVGLVESGSPLGAMQAFGLALVFVAFMATVVRQGLIMLSRRYDAHGRLTVDHLAIVVALVLLSAYATEFIGIHSIFGAFIAGAIMPKPSGMTHEITAKIEDFTVIILLPIFFAVAGLRTDLFTIDSPALLGWTALILLAAVGGKFIGCGVAARLTGSNTKEAVVVGSLMNTRGLTELVILGIGVELAVLSDRTYAMMVIMALSTTVMAAPIVNRLMPRTRLPSALAGSERIAHTMPMPLPVVPHLQRLDDSGAPVATIEVGSQLTVGRSYENTVVLPTDELASRRHARIAPDGERFAVEDLESSNGIRIWRDGKWQPVRQREGLEEHDILVIGSNAFRFSMGAEVEQGRESEVGA